MAKGVVLNADICITLTNIILKAFVFKQVLEKKKWNVSENKKCQQGRSKYITIIFVFICYYFQWFEKNFLKRYSTETFSCCLIITNFEFLLK